MTRTHTLNNMCRNGNRRFGILKQGASGTGSVSPRRKPRRPGQPMASVLQAGLLVGLRRHSRRPVIWPNAVCRKEFPALTTGARWSG